LDAPIHASYQLLYLQKLPAVYCSYVVLVNFSGILPGIPPGSSWGPTLCFVREWRA